jgi:hypothetical protein
MTKRRSSQRSELWDEPEEPQGDEAEETWEASGRASDGDDEDWEEEGSGSSGWLDDALDDLESELPQDEDAGDVYRLLGRSSRRGHDD